MKKQDDTPQQSTSPTPESVPGYGAALMEAVHRQPRQATGFGSAAQRSDSGLTRPAARGATAQTPATRPTPMPKRPKGRLLVGVFLLLICGTGAATIWNSVFRYQAYGAVTGRVVELCAPWGGVLQTVHVREGDVVLQGQLLATVVNPELDRQIAAKLDELSVAQATLDSRVSQLRYQTRQQDDGALKTFTEYKRMRGDLREQQQLLAGYIASREKAESLVTQNLITQEALDELRVKEKAAQAKSDELVDAVRALEQELDKKAPELQDQLKPDVAKIEAVQNEIGRLQDTSRLGEIRAPVNGRVINVHRFTGEYSDPEFPIFDIVVDGSVEAILYVSQKHSQAFHEGLIVELDVPPSKYPAKCRVVRIADRYETVPKNIELHYRREEKLLPIYLQPLAGAEHAEKLRLGSEVRLPYRLPNPLSMFDE